MTNGFARTYTHCVLFPLRAARRVRFVRARLTAVGDLRCRNKDVMTSGRARALALLPREAVAVQAVSARHSLLLTQFARDQLAPLVASLAPGEAADMLCGVEVVGKASYIRFHVAVKTSFFFLKHNPN